MKLRIIIFSFLLTTMVTLITGCAQLGGTKVESTKPIQEPSTTPRPTYTTDPFPNPTLKIVGDEEIVFDWTTDRCEIKSIPDLPARAFYDSSGQVQLIVSNTTNYRMIGQNLNNLESECTPIQKSSFIADPSLFSDNEWIGSIYTEDGQTIYALIHNEYQGHTHPGKCPQREYFPCWYNTITLAVSTDSGLSYHHAAEPPDHLIAALPYQYEAGAGPYGIRNPSNIIKGKDNFFYAYLNVSDYQTHEQWVCLMRTDNLSDPKAWRFWNGNNFDGQFVNPYLDPLDNPRSYKCQALDWNDIGVSLNDSITYNTYLNRYVLIGISADHINGREVWGFYYSFSDDLINWTHRKLLIEIDLPWTVANPGNDLSYLYPSLLDPESQSQNFHTTDKTAYLYYTRNNHGHASLDRDLIRVPVEFFPDETQ